jgi:hypothetical protein
MINFEKTENGGRIEFDAEDVETIIKVLHRALNTWSPSPPKELLNVQADIINLCR